MNEDSESAISDDLEIPNIQHPPTPQLIKRHMLLLHSVDWCMVQPNTCTHTHNAFELCCSRADALASIPMQFKSFEKKSCIDD
jgi:hypothetical protein